MTRKRLEFSKPVKLELFRRAGGPEDLRCEGKGCGISLRGKRFEYDHIIEEWEREDIERGYREPLTADDGQVLCIPCHNAKSGKKTKERWHGKRIIEEMALADEPENPMPFGRSSTLRKKVNGDIVDRETGEVIRKGRR